MDTITIVCLGIAATIVVLSTFSVLRILSQVSEDDEHLKQLIKKQKDEHE